MATLNRWDPFRDIYALQEQFARALRGTGATEQELQAAWTPLVDVWEDSDGIQLSFEVPGVDQKNIDVTVEGNTLTVRGERSLEKEDKRDNYHRIERTYGSFARSFTLPNTVDSEHIAAEYNNGVLKLVLPKRAEAKPKQIKVSVEPKLTGGQKH